MRTRAGMTIGELARRSGVAASRIRYYEKVGLLSEPRRSEGGYRLYGEAALDRIKLIQHCRTFEMSLPQTATFIRAVEHPDGTHRNERHALVRAHLARLDAQIAQLQSMRVRLSQLSHCCDGHHDADALGCEMLTAFQAQSEVEETTANEVLGEETKSW